MTYKASNSQNVNRDTKKKASKRDVILVTIFIIIIVLSLLSVTTVYLMNSRFFKNTENHQDSQNGGKIASEIVTPAEIKEKTQNFLICGIDYLEGSNRGKLTDVIMFVSFDIENKNVDVLQIPRDSYIGDDYPTGKINAIYGQRNGGGVDGLAKRINKTLNLTIDHYVTLDMNGFVSIIDKIGGVEVDVPNYIDLEGVQLYPGLQTLDGNKAQIFVRERHSYANGDLGRMEMQKVFMEALVEKVFSIDMSQAASLAPTLITNITTDMNISEILGFFNNLISVEKSKINFHTLPVTGGMYKGLSVLAINRQETADLLNEYFRPHSEPVSAEKLGILDLVFDAPKVSSTSSESVESVLPEDEYVPLPEGGEDTPSEDIPLEEPSSDDNIDIAGDESIYDEIQDTEY